MQFFVVLNVCVLSVFTHASWVPRPLNYYRSSSPEMGTPAGVQRFSHQELHSYEDGSNLDLRWEVDADPDTILALDLEQEAGVSVLVCMRNKLVLQMPGAQTWRAAKWEYVTASEFLHKCTHLEDKNLYHHVLRVERIAVLDPEQKSVAVTLVTEELTSPSQIFSHCTFAFVLTPASVKNSVGEQPQHQRQLSAKITGEDAIVSGPMTFEKNIASPPNLNAPPQITNVAWNWDYAGNATKNPQIKAVFPSMEGYMKFYRPYFKANFSININFTSHAKDTQNPPYAFIVGELNGHADFNVDLATAIDFTKNKSMIGLDDALEWLDVPGLPNNTFDEIDMKPMKMYLGGTPVTIRPSFCGKLKAYHRGRLKGSLRFGLGTRLFLRGSFFFDTYTGLQTNLSGTAQKVRFNPPTWMLFPRHFELGIIFEADFWMKGIFSETSDMAVGFGLRPYLNISIMQKVNATSAATNAARNNSTSNFGGKISGLPLAGTHIQGTLHGTEAPCHDQLLKYSAGAGVTFIPLSKDVPFLFTMWMTKIMGGALPLDGNGSKTEPIPIFEFGTNGNELCEMLPRYLCMGWMPYCQTDSKPIKIKQIDFKLNRHYDWKKHVGPRMRHNIAYALALFPSAVKMFNQRQIAKPHSSMQDTRRLWSLEGNKEVEDDGTSYNAFTVEIAEPMEYEISEQFLKTLLHQGAFKIEDGRENTHGPLFIEAFELHDISLSTQPVTMHTGGGGKSLMAVVPFAAFGGTSFIVFIVAAALHQRRKRGAYILTSVDMPTALEHSWL